MYKKMIKAVTVIAAVIIVIGAVWYTENHKESPGERSIKQFQKQQNTSDNSEDGNTKKAVPMISSGGLMYMPISYKILSETDPRLRSDYKKGFYYEDEYPDPDYKDEEVDIEGMKQASPELKQYFDNAEDYTYKESKEIIDRNADLIKEYTRSVHPKTRYLFIDMEIINTKSDMLNDSITPYVEGEDGNISSDIIYFDKAVHLSSADGDRADFFAWYNFKPNEKLSCTIGYRLKEKEFPEDRKIYLGYPPVGKENLDIETDDNVVCLDDLEEIK